MFMKFKGKKILALFLVLLMLIVGACSNKSSTNGQQSSKPGGETNSTAGGKQQTPKKGGEVKFAIGTIVSNLDPIKGSSGYDFITLYNMFDTLVSWDNDLQAQPGLATSWETPDDKTVILHLREGVKFHDGTPFDAQAVKTNLDRVNAPESKVTDLINVASTEAIDAKTIKITLKQPDSSLLLKLSDRAGMMVSPKVLENSGGEFKPIGTGPFQFVSWVPNGEVVMEAFDEYWDESLPYLDKLTVIPMPDENTRINGVTSGQIDVSYPISTNNIPTLKKNPNISLDSSDQIQSWQMYLNTAKAPLDNVKVRQALLYAIDRDALNKAILLGLGKPAYQHFPEGYWANNPDVKLPYDPEKSKKLLKEAGVENVELEIVYQSAAFPQRLMEAVTAQLDQVGIKVKLVPMELTKGVTELFSEKRYNAGMFPWTGRPDPQMTVQSLWGKTAFYNAGSRNSEELDAIINKSAATYDPKEREKVIKEAVKVAIIDDAMNLPLVFEPATAAMSKKVSGYQGNLAGKPKLRYLWINQ
jgi:peptide/nickel transport system substrate-binding protein